MGVGEETVLGAVAVKPEAERALREVRFPA
jgi:hypothetical protein